MSIQKKIKMMRLLLVCTVVPLILIGIMQVQESFAEYEIPPAFADNAFCNMDEDLKIREELIKDNVVLVEFLKVFPDAKLETTYIVDHSDPGQTYMTWVAGAYSLGIHIFGYDEENPSECFVPGGYRLNAPHLPEMVGLDYHKDPAIVLEQIAKIEAKYVKGESTPMLEYESIEPSEIHVEGFEPEEYIDPDYLCPSNLVLDWDICVDACPLDAVAIDGICRTLGQNYVGGGAVYLDPGLSSSDADDFMNGVIYRTILPLVGWVLGISALFLVPYFFLKRKNIPSRPYLALILASILLFFAIPKFVSSLGFIPYYISQPEQIRLHIFENIFLSTGIPAIVLAVVGILLYRSSVIRRLIKK